MQKKKKIDNREILAVISMACLFVIIHFLAILITNPFEAAGLQPAFENPDDPINIIYVVVILLVFTLIILLIAKYWKKQLIQAIILGAIGYTAAYVFYYLFLSFDFPSLTSFAFSVAIAVIVVFTLYDFPEWYVIDICGIIIGTGAIAIFGMSLGVLLVIILLIGLSIYDAISVYKTKHMIELADTVMDLKLPVLLVIPKTKGYSLIKETKGLKESVEKGKERDAFFMGLGDIVMPGILVASVFNNIEGGLPISISIIIGTLVGFAILMGFVIKGKPQAGLPALCGGAIAGYLISSLVLFGELKGLSFNF